MILAVSVKSIILAGAVTGILGVLLGLLLGVAGKLFNVETDEKVEKVRECLPGNNCGGCGFPGCDGLATAIAEGKAAPDTCPVANEEAHLQIAKIMGAEITEKERMVAYVKCAGTCDKAERKYNYYGISDCRNVVVVPGQGDKSCAYGCLGLGSCVSVCTLGAISIVDGVAKVDKEVCRGCGRCATTCPKHVIELVPYRSIKQVACNSNEKGKAVKVACKTGCIGCGICAKQCESGAIVVENNLAKIDAIKCTGCGKCAEKCPQHIIVEF